MLGLVFLNLLWLFIFEYFFLLFVDFEDFVIFFESLVSFLDDGDVSLRAVESGGGFWVFLGVAVVGIDG